MLPEHGLAALDQDAGVPLGQRGDGADGELGHLGPHLVEFVGTIVFEETPRGPTNGHAHVSWTCTEREETWTGVDMNTQVGAFLPVSEELRLFPIVVGTGRLSWAAREANRGGRKARYCIRELVGGIGGVRDRVDGYRTLEETVWAGSVERRKQMGPYQHAAGAANYVLRVVGIRGQFDAIVHVRGP